MQTDRNDHPPQKKPEQTETHFGRFMGARVPLLLYPIFQYGQRMTKVSLFHHYSWFNPQESLNKPMYPGHQVIVFLSEL
jgi:hypothetical protein